MSKYRPDAHMLSGFCEMLTEAVSVGLPIGEVFAELRDSERENQIKALYSELCSYAETGVSLSEALTMSGVFPAYMTRLIAVGEMSGHAERTLMRLSAYYALQNRLNSALKTSVLYPAALFCVIVCVLFVVATEVLPVFRGVYAQLGAELPSAAAAVFRIGDWLRSVRVALGAVLLSAVILFVCVLMIPSLRERSSNALVQGIGGKAKRFHAAADICSVLAMTCSAGIEPADGLRMAAELIGSAISAQVFDAADAMKDGEPLSASLQKTGLFEEMDLLYIDLAVRSGTLTDVAAKLAERYTNRAEEIFFRRVAIVEPVAVLTLALCIGLMLLGVMLPLLGALSVLG